MKNYSDSLEREVKRLEDQGKELRKKLHAARHLFGVTAEGAGRLETEVIQLRAAIARKDEALKPFAVAANAIPAILSDDNWPRLNPNKATITVGHCRAAKRALESKL